MNESQGFWSYVHADDLADNERISRLAKDVVAQFEMLTGETILLFLDKDTIEWGENWREKIDSSLSSIAFFIPVLTPRYFMRPECRRELQYFARQASDLGVKELILPLLYVDFPILHDATITDDLIKLVCTFQWEDWTELRFSEVTSEGYRRGVARLASRLVEANKKAEGTIAVVTPRVEETPEESIDDAPGVIDILANAEEKALKLPETLKLITQDISQIGEIMQEATDDIHRGDAQGQGFGVRLMVARRTAHRITDHINNIMFTSNNYASQLHDVDVGYRIIIERAQSDIKENPDSKVSFCSFFVSVFNMSKSSNEAMMNMKKMLSASEPLEKMSRDLRPVLRSLRQGLTILIESTEVINDWVHLIESSGILCDGIDT